MNLPTLTNKNDDSLRLVNLKLNDGTNNRCTSFFKIINYFFLNKLYSNPLNKLFTPHHA